MNRTRLAILIGLVIGFASTSHAQFIIGSVGLSAWESNYATDAQATLYGANAQRAYGAITAYHRVYVGSPPTPPATTIIHYQVANTAQGGFWANSGTTAPMWNTCGQATLWATSPGATSESEATPDWRCQPSPPPPPPNHQPGVCNPDTPDCGDPIVIALGPAANYEFTTIDNGVQFDINGDDIPESIAWIKPGAENAFLWYDRNANGRVDNGSELFGDSFPLAGGIRSANGFQALQFFDSNADGLIDMLDVTFDRLRLWRDANHNGVSESDEITSLLDWGIASISLDYSWIGRRDENGNTYKYRAFITYGDSSVRYERRPIYDVFLQLRRN